MKPADIKWDISTTLLSKGIECPIDVSIDLVKGWLVGVDEVDCDQAINEMLKNPNCPVKEQAKGRICYYSKGKLRDYVEEIREDTSWM